MLVKEQKLSSIKSKKETQINMEFISQLLSWKLPLLWKSNL
jgi:hypothetical protein